MMRIGRYMRQHVEGDDRDWERWLNKTGAHSSEPQLFGTAANNGQMIDEMDRADRIIEALPGLIAGKDVEKIATDAEAAQSVKVNPENLVF